MHMGLGFNSQCGAGKQNVGKIKVTFLQFVLVSAAHFRNKCLVLNHSIQTKLYQVTHKLQTHTHTHTEFNLLSYPRCPCIYHMKTHVLLLIKSAVQLHSPTTEMKNCSWIRFQLFREYISVSSQMVEKVII